MNYFRLLEDLTDIKVAENKNYLLNFLIKKLKKEDKAYTFRNAFRLAKEIPDKNIFYLEYLNFLVNERIQYVEFYEFY